MGGADSEDVTSGVGLSGNTSRRVRPSLSCCDLFTDAVHTARGHGDFRFSSYAPRGTRSASVSVLSTISLTSIRAAQVFIDVESHEMVHVDDKMLMDDNKELVSGASTPSTAYGTNVPPSRPARGRPVSSVISNPAVAVTKG